MAWFQPTQSITAKSQYWQHLIWSALLTVILSCCANCSTALAQASTVASLNSQLSDVERKFFEHSYADDDTSTRLSRLEQMVFGEQRSGSTADRLANLLAAIPTTDPIAALDNTPSSTASQNYNDQPSIPASDHSVTIIPPLSSSSEDITSPSTAQSTDSNDFASDTSSPDISDVDDYARVTALEEKLLGQTYRQDSVRQRLARLETKAFGKPSSTEDLAERTDLLQAYVNNTFPDSSEYHQAIAGQYHPSPSGTIDDQICMLEKQVFGKTDPSATLIKRVSKLESNIFPNDPPDTAATLSVRVARMSAATSIASSDSPPEESYKPQKRHPLLDGIAKTMGSLAMGAISSGMMMNSPYAYPGYGMGYPYDGPGGGLAGTGLTF